MRNYRRGLLAIAVFLLLWECIARAEPSRAALFPPPTRVFVALLDFLRSGDFFTDILASLSRAAVGFVLGSMVGIAVGLLTGRIEWIHDYLSPVIQLFRPLPPVAIIPLVIVWFGIGEVSKVFSIAFAVFFPVWISAHLGAREVPITYLWSARIMGVSPFASLYRVIFPSSLPFLMAGLRTGVSLAFVMVFVSELAGASSGIGYEINASYLAYRVDRMIAALIVLAAFGSLSDWLLTGSASFFFPWLKLKPR